MIKSGIDQDAIVKMFSEATAKQGEALRKAVGDATLKALQGRELTMENIKKVVKTMTTATSMGAAQNSAGPVDVEGMLGKAFAGMDNALLQAVEANRKALQQFVDQGTGLQAKPLQDAIANIEKMEETFFTTVSKAAQGMPTTMQGPWQQVLNAGKANGTDTGAQATQTVQNLMAQTQTALRASRAATAKGAQAMLDGYAAMVSGVLIGMSEGLRSRGSAAASGADDTAGGAQTAAPKPRSRR
jgi:hypothetical protein